MSDFSDTSVGRRRCITTLHGVALAAAPAVSAPAWAQSAQEDYTYPADIDCNNPYYAAYCLEYATWLNQYYVAYGYRLFLCCRWNWFLSRAPFSRLPPFVFAHGIRFHGGLHGGAFHSGGFHGGGHR